MLVDTTSDGAWALSGAPDPLAGLNGLVRRSAIDIESPDEALHVFWRLVTLTLQPGEDVASSARHARWRLEGELLNCCGARGIDRTIARWTQRNRRALRTVREPIAERQGDTSHVITYFLTSRGHVVRRRLAMAPDGTSTILSDESLTTSVHDHGPRPPRTGEW